MSDEIKRCRFCGDRFLPEPGDSFMACFDCVPAIERFWTLVCTRAEAKMLETGRLEGAHYAAATEIIAEMRMVAE